MDHYEKVSELGKGASGTVHKARVRDPARLKSRKRGRESGSDAAAVPDYVAIKKINLKKKTEGLSREAIREIKILAELDDPHVIRLLDVFKHQSNVNLVLEVMETNLKDVIVSDAVLRPADIKAYMLMLIRAVRHCHARWVLHRDIKPENLLIARDGSMQLSDFGLAKAYGSPNRKMSPTMCTIWYRAPEMLFGSKSYGPAVDMWSVGCVFAELLRCDPMFKSNGTEIHQLKVIFSKLGTPRSEDWPDAKHLPSYISFSTIDATPWKAMFPAATQDCLDLLQSLLQLNPSKRLSADQALKHRYFALDPQPTPPDQMPTLRGREGKPEGKN